MKIPGPDHPITIEPAATRWRAMFAGHVIADSADALVLQESSYAPVVYFPREDVAMEYFSRTDRATNCPYKGDAAYYTIMMDGQFAENAVWSYEDPYPAMSSIANRLAFYPDKVEVYVVDDAAANPNRGEEVSNRAGIDEIIQHTDAGAGASQREPWPANTDGPRPEGGVR